MATSNLELQSLPVTDSTVPLKKVVNDFAINVATVNGSGSQSANSILLRSIFNMGVPVSGKNLFPSNIAGLPTWYLIRASKDGWVARKSENDFLIAMNPETVTKTSCSCAPAAPSSSTRPQPHAVRDDVVYYPVPFDKPRAAGAPRPSAQAHQEHGLCRRRGPAARHRHKGVESDRAQAVCQEVEGRRPELEGGPGRLRLRCQTPHQAGRPGRRTHERHQGQDHHRRQRRLRDGRHVCRRHGRRLVSDHAVHRHRRRPHQVHEDLPRGERWQSQFRHRPG